MFKSFFKSTFRSLWKNKTYSFLNIFGLAVGIACAGLIFLWVEDEVNYDSNNIKKDKLYVVLNNQSFGGNTFTNWSSPRVMASSILKEIPGIVNTCRVDDSGKKLLFTINDKKVYADSRYADPSLFSMLTLPFIQGNAQSAFVQPYSVVVTQATAKKFFGKDENIVGKTVRIDNRQDYVVTGVIKDLPANTSLQFECLLPYPTLMAERRAKWGPTDETTWEGYGPFIYAELSDKANLAAINKQLYNYIHQKNASQTSHSFLFPMKDWHLYSEFENGKQTGGGQVAQVRMMSIIAWVILAIACINFMNLSTARSGKYAKEVGVRKVLGSSRKKLVTRFVVEALFMAFLAGIAALIIIALALPAFNLLMQTQLALSISNPAHIAALLLIIVIAGLTAASYPSLYLSSFNPVVVLKGLKVKEGGAAFIRKALVVLQFSVSVIFIISTIIVYKQIQHVKNRKLGFDKDKLIEIDMQTNVNATFPLIKQHLLSTGAIQNAAMSNHVLLEGGDTDDRFKWQGKQLNNEVSIAFRNITPELVSTYGLHITEGRDFTQTDAAGAPNVIINKTLANILGKGSAVGKIIQSPRGQGDGKFENLTVIGVVDDYVFGNAYGRPGPLLLFNKPVDYGNLLYVRVRANANIEKTVDAIEGILKKDNPAYPLQYRFVDEQFDSMFKSEVQMSRVSGIFAVLAIIISCLGLFGLAAFTAEQRVKEIGIRKVLGASVQGLAGLLSKEFIQLVAVSCVIAFPVAWWVMHSWLQNYEYKTTIHWWVFALSGVCAIVIALLTVSFQTVKAAMMNPVKAIRTDS